MVEKIRKNNKLLIPIIVLVLIIILGVTYAWMTFVVNGTKVNRITVGALSLVLDDEASNGINIENGLPQTDAQGLNNTEYTFNVINNGASHADYKLYLEDEDITEDRIPDSNIKFNLKRNGVTIKEGLLSSIIKNDKRELESIIINSNTTNNYSLRLWIDQDSSQEEVGGKVFQARIKLEAVQTENSFEDTYSIDGYIYDNNDNKITNGVVVTYSEPTYADIDSEGHFDVTWLEYGEHTIYYIPGKTKEEVKALTQEEISNIENVGKAKITTSSSFPIELDNGYILKEGTIKKEEKKRLIYDYKTNGGERENEIVPMISGEKANLEKTGEREGYEFVGWNTDKDAHVGLEEIEINDNMTIYAIYKKEGRTNRVVFNKNATIGETIEKSCEIPTVYNREEQPKTCSITTPTITVQSGYNKIGWNTSSNGTTSDLNENTTINVSSNGTYYAIQSKTVTITYTKGEGVDSIGSTGLSCTMYNNGTCSITMPSITAITKYQVLGWKVTNGTLDTSLDSEPEYYEQSSTYTINNNSTNSITATAQAKPELVINYGTSIASLYNTIYLIENETKTAIEKQTYGTWSGNYLGYATVENKIIGGGNRITSIPNSSHQSVIVTSGNNTINFTSLQSNKWVVLRWHWGAFTTSMTLSNIKLVFSNGKNFTINQAVTNGYIEPLVMYLSADSRTNWPYTLDNPSLLLDGGSQTESYSGFPVAFKVKNISPLKGVTFSSSKAWSTSYDDGFDAFSNPNVDFSIQ